MLSALVHYCNFGTEHENYGLGDSLALQQLNIKQTPTKLELGNAKLQNFQVSGLEE